MGRRSGMNFIKGAVLGVLAGVTAGVLFAPKSGKETREDLKKKAEELKAQAEDLYEKARAELDEKVTALKKAGNSIDKAKYEALVAEVVEQFKSNKDVTADSAKKLGRQLSADWERVKKAAQA